MLIYGSLDSPWHTLHAYVSNYCDERWDKSATLEGREGAVYSVPLELGYTIMYQIIVAAAEIKVPCSTSRRGERYLLNPLERLMS